MKTNPKKKPAAADSSFRILPQAPELEEVVLGTLMLENASLSRVENLLSPEIFCNEKHQAICQAILNLKERDQPFDILMVCNELRNMGKLDESGGAYYLTGLTARVASGENICFHAGVLFEKFLLRKVIQHADATLKEASQESADAFSIVESSLKELEELNSLTDDLADSGSLSAIEQTIREVISKNQDNAQGFYLSGVPGIDKVIGIGPNELLLIGGPAGAGKTRFVIFLMESLLRRYPDISVMWFSFEDPKEKIIRCFASINLMIREEQLRGKKGKLSSEQLQAFLDYMKVFGKYDIVFVEESKAIRQVGSLFNNFCKTRPGRFNICIIDNLLLLEDDSNDRDDIIAKELNRIRKRTRGLILPIHHFNDEQMAKDMLRYAYRPRVVHLKGRESYRRACTQILLINKPGNYADLVAEYKGLEDILQHLFIIDIAKNRDGNANDDRQTLIRLWSNLDYLIFKDL